MVSAIDMRFPLRVVSLLLRLSRPTRSRPGHCTSHKQFKRASPVRQLICWTRRFNPLYPTSSGSKNIPVAVHSRCDRQLKIISNIYLTAGINQLKASIAANTKGARNNSPYVIQAAEDSRIDPTSRVIQSLPRLQGHSCNQATTFKVGNSVQKFTKLR